MVAETDVRQVLSSQSAVSKYEKGGFTILENEARQVSAPLQNKHKTTSANPGLCYKVI